MRVILDTNVVVAGLRSQRGASSAIEYEGVLKRDPERLAMFAGNVNEFVAFLCANAERRELPARSWPVSEDPDDEFLAQLAVVGACDFVVTHNVRHFRALAEQGPRVVTPSEFLKIVGGQR